MLNMRLLLAQTDGTVLDVEETSSADGFLHVKVVEDLRRNSSPEIEKSSKVGVSVPVGGRGNHHGQFPNLYHNGTTLVVQNYANLPFNVCVERRTRFTTHNPAISTTRSVPLIHVCYHRKTP